MKCRKDFFFFLRFSFSLQLCLNIIFFLLSSDRIIAKVTTHLTLHFHHFCAPFIQPSREISARCVYYFHLIVSTRQEISENNFIFSFSAFRFSIFFLLFGKHLFHLRSLNYVSTNLFSRNDFSREAFSVISRLQFHISRLIIQFSRRCYSRFFLLFLEKLSCNLDCTAR